RSIVFFHSLFLLPYTSPTCIYTLSLHDALPISHLGLLGAFVQVVIPQQVEDGVDGQISQLPLDAVAELLCLGLGPVQVNDHVPQDRKSTRLNSSHVSISYAVFCLKKKRKSITKE